MRGGPADHSEGSIECAKAKGQKKTQKKEPNPQNTAQAVTDTAGIKNGRES